MSHPLARRALAALLLVCGCSVDNDPVGPTGPGQSFTTYLSAVTTAAAEYERGCGLLDAGRADARRTQLLLAFPTYLTEVKDTAAKQGRTSYSATCVQDALRGAACSPTKVSEVLAACAGREAAGRLAAGRVCRLHDECQAGYCKGVPLADGCGTGACAPLGQLGAACPEGPRACDPKGFACQDGACFPRVAAGATCRDDALCQDGLRCLRNSANDAEGKCGAPVLAGENQPCDLLDFVGKGCQSGLSCYKDTNQVYRCQRIIAVGQPCTYSESCAAPATCALAPNAMTGTCKVLGKAGETCDLARGAACQTTLVCYAKDMNAQALCTALPLSGELCDGDRLPCLAGACAVSQGASACAPRAGAGLACVANSDCATNLCDSATRRCRAPSCQ